MKEVRFNNDAFVLALDAVRASKGMNWKQVAAEVHVSASTLSRLLMGKTCDVHSLAKLVHWCGVDFKRFIAI